jgi:hypothetical protein
MDGNAKETVNRLGLKWRSKFRTGFIPGLQVVAGEIADLERFEG